jgi:S1-C subfamily serine protease
MNVFGRFKRLFCFLALAFHFSAVLPVPCLRAEDSPVSTVLETSKAMVDIQSVNTAVMSGKPQGFIDKATGWIVVRKKVRPVGYTRSGSGVIIDPRGIVVTNAHTIRGAGGLAVTLFNGTRAPVKEAHLVPGTDIAFLTIDPPFALASITLADSDLVSRGLNVYTIGHSQWLKGTVLGGKLLGVQREKIAGVSRVTALRLNFDMEKGDSGCPVLDARGELLGIVGASIVGRGSATLAIPSNAIAVALKAYLTHQEI